MNTLSEGITLTQVALRRMLAPLVAGLVAFSALVAATGVAEAAPGEARLSANLEADYRFQNTLRSTKGTNKQLRATDVGNLGFGMEEIDGKLRSVLVFDEGFGLDLRNSSNVIPNDEYTIVILMRFDDVSAYRRVINFQRNASDNGLYIYNGFLHFYPSAEGSTSQVGGGEWFQVVLSRSSAGVIKGYINGQKVIEFDDINTDGVVDDGDILRFFRDNTNDEEGSGAVARIRLYDGALSDAEVAGLDRVAPRPKLVLKPGAGDFGEYAFKVKGKNFAPKEYVRIRFRPPQGTWETVGTVKADGAGKFSLDVAVPGNFETGVATVKGKGLTSGLIRKASFQIS